MAEIIADERFFGQADSEKAHSCERFRIQGYAGNQIFVTDF
jgi:hypothetical protein